MVVKPPRKLIDRTLKLDEGSVQLSSPRWDWVSWGHQVLVTFTPNYFGIAGASLLSATQLRRLASEFTRRADNLDAQRSYEKGIR